MIPAGLPYRVVVGLWADARSAQAERRFELARVVRVAVHGGELL